MFLSDLYNNKRLFENISPIDLAEIIFNSLMQKYPEAVQRYGHEVVGDAVIDYAEDAEDIHSMSDIDIAVDEILDDLENFRGDRTNDLEPDNLAPLQENKDLSIQDLAVISDQALDAAYGYGRSSPGNTFGWQANLQSAAYAKKVIDGGVTDIETIADAIHKGWNNTAKAFVNNPDQFSDTEKLKAAGKLDTKLQQRAKLMQIDYAALPEDEKEKDRVVARVLLQAITGQNPVTENLRKWFKEKWVRFGPDGKIRGACARGDESEGKPKCLPQAKAHALGKKGRKYAAAKKRREDPNPERRGAAVNVATKKKSNEGVAEGRFDEPLTGWHIVYRNSGNPVHATPSFETKEQAQKFLMTKMFANHQDYKVVHTAGVGVAEGLITGRNLNPATKKYVKDHKWKLITINPMDLDTDAFDDPYNRVIDIDPDHPVDFKDPIIVDANGVIIDGFHRVYQAKQQGLKKLPAYVPVQGVAEGQSDFFYQLERLDPRTRQVLTRMADHKDPGSWLSASEAYAMSLGLQYKNRDPRGWEREVQHYVDLWNKLTGKQGVAEGHTDQQKKIFKKNGQPVGEVGIDRESSPGVGQWYMKCYAYDIDNSGYDSYEEAVAELKHCLKQGVAEATAMPVSDYNIDLFQQLVQNYKPKSHAGELVKKALIGGELFPESETTIQLIDEIYYENIENGYQGPSFPEEVSDLRFYRKAMKKSLYQGVAEQKLDEACWKGYHKEGNKKMFGKTYPNCVKNEGVAEGFNGISVDIEPELDYDVVYVDINGKKHNFNYWYSDEKPTDELGFRKDIPQYLKREEWYNRLDQPTKMEILHAVVQAELGKEPSEYKPTVDDEPLDLDEHGVVEDRSQVRRIQQYLNKEFNANLDVDGVMGALTKRSIEKFLPSSKKKTAPNPEKTTAVQGAKFKEQLCPECGGPAFSNLVLAEKQDACYHKVKSRYKVWPSAYASGALVQCRKKGAANWGNKKTNEAKESPTQDYQKMMNFVQSQRLSGVPAEQQVAVALFKELEKTKAFNKELDAELKAAGQRADIGAEQSELATKELGKHRGELEKEKQKQQASRQQLQSLSQQLEQLKTAPNVDPEASQAIEQQIAELEQKMQDRQGTGVSADKIAELEQAIANVQKGETVDAEAIQRLEQQFKAAETAAQAAREKVGQVKDYESQIAKLNAEIDNLNNALANTVKPKIDQLDQENEHVYQELEQHDSLINQVVNAVSAPNPSAQNIAAQASRMIKQDTTQAQQAQAQAAPQNIQGLVETRFYFSPKATLAETLRSDFAMTQDRDGWYLTADQGPAKLLEAQRAFGIPKVKQVKLKEVRISDYTGRAGTIGDDNATSPIGSLPRRGRKHA